METIAGLFERYEDANQAVTYLLDAGFRREDISVLARQAVIEKVREDVEDVKVKDVAGSAGTGALGGGLLGGLAGLLMGLGAIAIPGLGPAFAAGTLATALGLTAGGAGVGAAVGGILGAMLGLSIPEEEAHVYAEGVRRGGVLVVVQADEFRAEQARTLLDNANALDTHALREEWQKAGWSRFDESQNSGPD